MKKPAYKRSKSKIGPYEAIEKVGSPRDVRLFGTEGFISKNSSGDLVATITNLNAKLRTPDFSEKLEGPQVILIQLSGLRGMMRHLRIPDTIVKMLEIANLSA